MAQSIRDSLLYLVPVPIGNLKDITLRGIEVLERVDFIVAEDTRYSLKLLNHLNIRKPLVSYYRPREAAKAEGIVRRICSGQSAALITDCGTPAVSDPGHILVKKTLEAGLKIVPLPGPTAFLPALVASGLDAESFLFCGFPPRKKKALVDMLRGLEKMSATLIFYESPRRCAEFLRRAHEVLGNRGMAIAKELTKRNEQIIRGNLKDHQKIMNEEVIRGEICVIIQGKPQRNKKDSPTVRIDSLEDIYRHFSRDCRIPKNHIRGIIQKEKT